MLHYFEITMKICFPPDGFQMTLKAVLSSELGRAKFRCYICVF